MKKRSSFRLVRAFDAVVILALIFQPVSAPVFFAPHVAFADDAVVVEETIDTEVAEENPAPVTQEEEELPVDENQKEAETAPDAEPTPVPAEDETEEGIVEAEGEASTEVPTEEGKVEAEGESFIEAPAKQTNIERISEPEKTEDDGDCDGDARCAEPVCSENSVINGSFGSPDVKNGHVWDYFDNNEVPGWEAEWYGGSSSFQNLNRPEPKIEIQAGVNGWVPASEQYAELDTDWDGPNGTVSGEPASISLKQTIPTIPGYEYVLTWDYAARPNHADNKMKVEVDGDSVFESGKIAGGGSINWITESYSFTASDDFTTISFTETGKSDSLGMFLDDVSLKCLGSEEPAEGTIIVRKETVPDRDETVFDFVLNGEEFSLSDGQAYEAVLLPGKYSVSETVPEGWDLTSAVCIGEESALDINLSDGETVTCTFTNTKEDPVVVPETGKITVEKRTKNAGSDQLFSFIPSYSGNFLLSNGGFQVSDFLAPGFYSVREAELYGWDLSALTCIDRAGVSTVSVDKSGMTAGIQLAAGGDVLCTFTNKDTKRSDDPWDGDGGNGGGGTTGGGLSVVTALAAGPVVISGSVADGAAETIPEDVSVEETEPGIVEGVSDCVGGWPLWAWILLVIVHTAASTLKRVIRKPVVQKWGVPMQLASAIVALVVWYIFDTCREYWPYVPIAVVFVSIASLVLFRHWKK